ncbi:hypothetical protein EII14_06360 [Alloprevotella sp. OH1205_COT-284]|uniref:hypothetical protein n=1 Tax=Alloprevotella sp. OH1205_COT-284 TaxID=2491043 RepID=UPI000F5DCBBF|nr:hypothetical protein [Alloprevotella sp. OH1205_COT-284]RRD79335.1 hypothetical protein EII14_06360 [Alloprevotella sp. OH1205_COT-284]
MINNILWVQDSINADTKLFLNGTLISHSDERFQRLYSVLCATDSDRKIQNGSKCEIFIQGKGGQKSYIIKGRYSNLDENGRRIPFMAYINNMMSLQQAKDELMSISSKHNFEIVSDDISVSEKKKMNLLITLLMTIIIGGAIGYLVYTCVASATNKTREATIETIDSISFDSPNTK